MKKLIAMLSAALLVSALAAGCSKKKDETTPTGAPAGAEETTPMEEPGVGNDEEAPMEDPASDETPEEGDPEDE